MRSVRWRLQGKNGFANHDYNIKLAWLIEPVHDSIFLKEM